MAQPEAVRLIVFDVDGVLTDGAILLDDRGVETKRFHVRDGFAVRAAVSVGLKVGVLSARSAPAVALRMRELGIKLLAMGSKNKATDLETIVRQAEVDLEQTAYLGDDILDLPALRRCGYPMAVADAVEEVRAVACYVTQAPGGHGAAREAVEHILKAQGRWESVRQRFGNSSDGQTERQDEEG